jgi:hypothetical protein
MIMHSRTLAAVLVTSLFLPALGFVFANSQTKRTKFDPDGSFWIMGKPPKGFEDFSEISLNAKRSRTLNTPGVRLTHGPRLRFTSLRVTHDKFTFTTAQVNGISYTFSGRFLKDGVFRATLPLDEETPVLEGTLTKLKGGQKVAEAELKFTYFGGT